MYGTLDVNGRLKALRRQSGRYARPLIMVLLQLFRRGVMRPTYDARSIAPADRALQDQVAS